MISQIQNLALHFYARLISSYAQDTARTTAAHELGIALDNPLPSLFNYAIDRLLGRCDFVPALTL